MLFSDNKSSTGSTQSLPPQPEGLIQAALDALSAHIVLLDDEGTIIGVNSAWRRFADGNGYSQANYGIGTNYLDICDTSHGRDSEEAKPVAAGIRRVMQRLQDEFHLEYPCHSPDEKRWFVLHVTHFDWHGRVRLVVAHQNVTELKKVQIKLNESHAHLEAVVNSVGNGILTVDNVGNIERINPSALAMFGYAPQEIIGRPLNILFGEPSNSLGYRELIKLLLEHPDEEWVGREVDGTLFPMSFILTELRSNRRWYTAVIQDLTERKKIEAELLEKERISGALAKERELRDYKNRFISVMSHELRTPLSSILLSSDLLKQYAEVASKEERDQFIDNIHTQVGYMTTMVKDMLALNRAEAHELDFAPKQIDLMDFVRQIVEEYKLTTQSHCFEMTRDSSPRNVAQSMSIALDQKLMRQVITNLITNGIKYSDPGSKISIDVSLQDDQAIVCIRDEGCGIPEEDLPLLFQPFHRAGNVGEVPGTGLGLSIVKHIVEMHDGSVHVESALNQGSVFTVMLPMNKSA
jgi:two-component system sensor kinase FixL